MLNPKWYEGMLEHGYEGVRQIEVHMTNTMGWSATTGQVQPWVYQQLTETFVLDPAMRERLAELNPTASPRWPTGCWKPSAPVLASPTTPCSSPAPRRRGAGRPPRRRFEFQPHEGRVRMNTAQRIRSPSTSSARFAAALRRHGRVADGEGSVQVQLDPG
jgi:hypothetical protein